MSATIQINETPLTCEHCGSTGVIKFGTYKGVQRYYCKVCKRKFTANDNLFHMKTPANQVSSALSMYYEGMSIKAIRRQLGQEHGNTPSTATIYEWIQKYTQYAIDSAKDYHPKVGDTWIADETVLEIDGQNVWFWDVIDEIEAKRAKLPDRIDKLEAHLDALSEYLGEVLARVETLADCSAAMTVELYLERFGVQALQNSDTFKKLMVVAEFLKNIDITGKLRKLKPKD